MRLKLRPTLLESFRLYQDFDWMEESSLIESIKGEFVPTEIVDVGTDYHLMLEDKQPKHGSYFEMESFYHYRLKTSGINEVKSSATINTDYGDVLISAMCDVLDGLVIHENKTSFKPFQAEKYLDSLQWKCYLHVFGCNEARYHVYKLINTKDGIVTQERNDLSMFRYDNMAKDIESYANGLLRFCELKGLFDYVQLKEAA